MRNLQPLSVATDIAAFMSLLMYMSHVPAVLVLLACIMACFAEYVSQSMRQLK